ncbi:hypothetical protein CDAR_489441 [Caerostris darwini]|uniref:Uncharacterized protein n=1 Tax=Caerostris darwini TaxID=1538125 RepID=A0AAV4U071_9ARAC|nr:hypothetical protein CDAR_489441 [Caerostris darwini]
MIVHDTTPNGFVWLKKVSYRMPTDTWDVKGILLIDYLAKGKTITGEYYSNLLDQLDAKIREKRPGLKQKRSSFTRTTHLCTRVR